MSFIFNINPNLVWFIIRNKYLVSVHCFWHRVPKTLGIFKVLRVIEVSFVMLMRWFLDLTEGWWLTARTNNLVVRDLELSILPSWPWERGEELEVESVTYANDLINRVYVIKPPLRTQVDRVQRTSGWVNTRKFVKSGLFGEAWKLHAFSLCLALCISSIWLFLSYILL